MEPSSTPWRVFDVPADGGSAAAAVPTAGGQPRRRSQVAAIVGLLGALAVGGLAVAIAVSGSGGEVVDGPAMGIGTAPSGTSERGASEIVVDVAGAVATPGIYHLAAGSRVGDAIEAAGGFSPRVDVGRVGAELNLAAELTDGAQVRVPSRDDADVPAGPSASTGSGGGLVDINTATEAELDALPGIGPVTAGKIIESRATAPFRSVGELRERGLVGEKTFEKIKAQLTVG